MMLPSAQTACSQTFWCGEWSSFRNKGMAPACTTLLVCSEVPDAIFVNAHAASNCSDGLLSSSRHDTSMGKMPLFIKGSIGGLRSADSSFLAV